MCSKASQITKHSLLDQLTKIPKSRKSRTNIVSPELCGTYILTTSTYRLCFLTLSDDVIQRLAPSLAQHVGCTIIDINPGIGLWSSKLHDYLKPRNHILMEPQQNNYLPFLQPLLDAPGSRYCLKDWPDSQSWQPKRYIEEGLLHDTKGYGGPLPTNEEPNNSILLIANLAGQSHKMREHSRAAISAHLKAIDFSHDVRHKTGFQHYGPTRMLMWLSEKDKRPLLPRTVGYRGKLSIYMEANVVLEEIVGSRRKSAVRIRREDALEDESSKQVATRMQEEGMKIPLDRQSRPIDRRSDVSKVSRRWHSELQELEEGFQGGKFSQYVKTPAAESINGHIPTAMGGQAKTEDLVPETPEYQRMMSLRYDANGQNVMIDRIQAVLREQKKIDEMDSDLYRNGIKASEQENDIKALESRTQDFKAELEKLTPKKLNALFFRDDDRRAFAMDPPLLLWDRRKAEPLLAGEGEFYAPDQIALLDFQPKATGEFPMTPEQSIYFDLILSSLYSPANQATLRRLDTIAPGAFEALVPQVPAIHDPRRGGRRDIESVRVRTVTPEMIHGLAVAWDKWTFKPPIEGMLNRFGVNSEERAESKRGPIARF